MAWVRCAGGGKKKFYLYRDGNDYIGFNNGVYIPSNSFANDGGWTFNSDNVSAVTPNVGAHCRVLNTNTMINFDGYSRVCIRYSDNTADTIDISLISQSGYLFLRAYADGTTDHRFYVEASTNKTNYATGRFLTNEVKRSSSVFTVSIKELWLE